MAKPKATARKPRKPRKPRLSAAERDRKLAVAHAAADSVRAAARKSGERLATALERLLAVARGVWGSARLAMAAPPSSRPGSWVTPWAIVGRFDFPTRQDGEGIGYADLYRMLRAWATDTRATKLIGADRLARIQVHYLERGKRSKPQQYTLGETLTWEFVLARAIARTDPNSDDDRPGENLATRYNQTRVVSAFVWFSAERGYEITGRLTTRRHARH